MSLPWWLETKRKIEEVNEAARTGRLDYINSRLEGLDRCSIFTFLRGIPFTDTNAFTIAIAEGQTEVVRLLVEKYKVNVNNRTFCREVPLLHTGKDCPLEITKILVENGADVNFVDRISKATALTRACGFNRLDVVQYLVEKGARINQELHDTTALHIASELNFSDLVRWLVGKGAAMNQVVHGGTALHNACGNRCLDAVRCLVECGADVNLAAGVYQETPLHAACQAESLDIVRFLVEHGANVNAIDREGCSPFGMCCKNDSTDVMRFLLENGADPNLPDHCGRTPLLHAAMNQKMQAVDSYIDLPTLSRQAKIDGLELLGASLILHSKFEEGHDYLGRAMRERYRDPLQAVEKVSLPPVPACGDFRESQTLEELTQRRWESTLLIKEALLIWERVLGRGTKEVKQVFSRVVAGGTDVPAAWLLRACTTRGSPRNGLDIDWLIIVALSGRCAFPILEETLRSTFQALSNHEHNSLEAHSISDFSSLYARSLVAFQKAVNVAQTEEEMHRLVDLLRNFLQLTMTGPNGSSALHVALGKSEFDFERMIQLNLSSGFISLLLHCKTDLINAQDEDGNTPLHLLFSRRHDSAELPVAETVTGMLLQAGAHLDARNRRSQTPLQCQHADQFQKILKDYTCVPPSLQCCCARLIVDENVLFHSLPEKMKKFIRLHGAETLDTKLPRRKALKRVFMEVQE